MSEEIIIKATPRSVTGKQVGAFRRSGQLPAVMYGKALEQPINIFLEAHSAGLLLPRISKARLIKIELDGKQYPVLVREKQRDVLTGKYLHIDFLAVSMTEKLRASVRIELKGVAPAVKEYNGFLVTGLEELEVECLPGDLPEHFTLDISSLKEIGDFLSVKDITIPERVELLSDVEEMVAQITAPMAEEVEEEVADDEAEPEVIEKGRKDEEDED